MDRPKSNTPRRSPKEKTLKALQRLERMGIFTVEDTIRNGTTQPTLSRLVRRGIVKRVGRGYYAHRYSKLEPKYLEFAMACRKFGYRAVIGGPSALYYHGLLSKAPKQVWVIVRYKQKSASAKYRCLKINQKPLIGVIDTQYFRVTNLERTLMECFRHIRKVGRARFARVLGEAIDIRRTSNTKLVAMEAALGFPRRIRAFLEKDP